MNLNNRKKAYCEWIAAIVVLLFCEWFFFRNILWTGKGAMIGDRGDGRLTMMLTEHWWRFFKGEEKFSELCMFYPAEGVLGYTDLFLGYGILHSLLRFAGASMYSAFKWTVISIHTAGTFSAYYLLKKKLNVSLLWSLFGTLAFSFSNALSCHMAHTQLVAVAYLPLIMIMAVGFVQNFNKRLFRNLYAYGFICIFVLLTYNSWYVACFAGLFGLILALTYVLCLVKNTLPLVSSIKKIFQTIWKDAIGYVLVTAVLYIPFIRIYLPVMKATSGYTYQNCTYFLPELIDIINVSHSNFMLGRFVENLKLSERGYSAELEIGFSIILLISFFVSWVLFGTKKKADHEACKEAPTDHRSLLYKDVLVIAIFITVIVCILSVIRLGANGISLWYLIYTLIPVVRSMRAVSRFYLWLNFPMAVITAYAANECIGKDKRIRSIIIAALAVLLIFISNINKNGASSNWFDCYEMAYISSVSKPPEDLECFYIIDTSKAGDRADIYQLDAVEIALAYSIKTINGYSGQSPEDWNSIWEVSSDGYEAAVRRWIKKYGLKNVYAYDRATNVWIPFSERMAALAFDVFCPAENKFLDSTGLLDWCQGDYAWTSKEFETTLFNSEIRDRGLTIKMGMNLREYLKQDPSIEPYVHIYVDGELVKDLEVVDGVVEFTIPMNNHVSDEYNIQIKTNAFFNPSIIGQSGDTRELSLSLFYIG